MIAAKRVAVAQGAFFALTGVWPLVHLRSFEAVTGPKLAGWLVKGMGTVLAVIGGSVLSAARNDRITPEIVGLINGAGLGLAALDVVYVAKRRIAPIYLADAAVEIGFALAWLSAARGAGATSSSRATDRAFARRGGAAPSSP